MCQRFYPYPVLIALHTGGFAHVYIARIEGKSGYVVLKRVAVPDGERLKMVEKEIAFMVSQQRALVERERERACIKFVPIEETWGS